jgi:acetyltransferase-like isoleucine patch superfamily enzyme
MRAGIARSAFIHPQALVESGAKIGARTRVWAFAHVLPNACVGAHCNICDQVFIEGDVHVGDRVTIKCGVQLWNGVRLEDDVFVGPNATFTNDPFPRSKRWPRRFAQTFVRKGASIGANATILPGLEIGKHSLVGAGAVVTRAVPPYAIVMGNPARVAGYTDAARIAPGQRNKAVRRKRSPK